MASSIVSMGDLAVVTSGMPGPVVAPVPGVAGAGDASQDAAWHRHGRYHSPARR
jgi:hypothetical protein